MLYLFLNYSAMIVVVSVCVSSISWYEDKKLFFFVIVVKGH